MTITAAYAILELDGTKSSPQLAKQHYRDLVRRYHPDGKPLAQQLLANEKTREIVEAYALLRERGFPPIDAHGEHAAPSRIGESYVWMEDMWTDEPAVNADAAAAIAHGISAMMAAAIGGGTCLVVALWIILRPGPIPLQALILGICAFFGFAYLRTAVALLGRIRLALANSKAADSPSLARRLRWTVAARLGLIVIALVLAIAFSFEAVAHLL